MKSLLIRIDNEVKSHLNWMSHETVPIYRRALVRATCCLLDKYCRQESQTSLAYKKKQC